MPASPAAPEQARRPRQRLYRRLLRYARWMLWVLLACVALVYGLRQRLVMPVIEAVVVDLLQEELGGRWQIAGSDGDLLTSIRLLGIERLAEPATGDAGLHIESVHVAWSPWALMGGDVLGSLRLIDVSGVAGQLDVDAILARAEAAPGEEKQDDDKDKDADWRWPLADACQMSFHGDVHLRVQGQDLAFQALDVLGVGKHLTLGARSWSLSGSDGGAEDEGASGADGPSSWRSFLSVSNHEAGMQIRSRGQLPLLGSLQTDAQVHQDGVTLTAHADWLKDLRVQGDRRSDGMHWAAAMTGLDLALCQAFVPFVPAHWHGCLPRSGQINLQLQADAVGLKLGSSAADIRLADHQLAWPVVQLRYRDGELTIPKLDLRLDGGRLHMHELRWTADDGLTALQRLACVALPLPLDLIPGLQVFPDGLTLQGHLQIEDEQLQGIVGLRGMQLSSAMTVQAAPAVFSRSWKQEVFAVRLGLSLQELQADQDALPDAVTFGLQFQGSLQQPHGELYVIGHDRTSDGAEHERLRCEAILRPGLVELQKLAWSGQRWQSQLKEPARCQWSTDGKWNLSRLQLQGLAMQADLRGAGQWGQVDHAHVAIDGPVGALLGLLDRRLQQWRGSLRLRADMPVGDGSDDLAHLHLDVKDLQAPDDVALQAMPVSSLDLDLRVSTQAITAKLAVTGGAQVHGQCSLAHAFKGDLMNIDELLGDAIQGELTVDTVQLVMLPHLVPLINYATGSVQGQATISGTLGRPIWQAKLAMQDVSLATGGLIPSLTGGMGSVALNNQGLRVNDVTIALGEAPVTVQGQLPWQPGNDFDLKLQGSNALLVQDHELRMRSDLNLHLHGPFEAPVLSGRLGVTDLVVSKHVDLLSPDSPTVSDPLIDLFSIDIPPWNRTRFDITIADGSLLDGEAGNGLRIRSNMLSARLKANLRLGGTGAVPEPVGTVTANEGRLTLPFTSYTIERASVRFERGNPWDPVLNIVVSGRMQGYDVIVNVSGRMLDPRVQVSTSPPLPNDEALLLAAAGIRPSSEDGGNHGTMNTLLPWLGNELRRFLLGPPDPDAGPSFIDRFTLRLDEERSEDDVSSARIEFALVDQWFLYGERDAYEAYNGGLLWRWTIGQKRVQEQEKAKVQAIDESRMPWRIRSSDEQMLPVSEGRLLRLTRRDRRAFLQATRVPRVHLAAAAADIQNAVRNTGYAQATVSFQVIEEEAVHFSVRLGPVWRIGDVEVTGVPPGMKTEVDKQVQGLVPVGDRFRPGTISVLESNLSQLLRLDGYAKGSIDSEEPEFDAERGVILRFAIRAGRRQVFADPQLEFDPKVPLEPAVVRRLQDEAQLLLGRPWLRRSARLLQVTMRRLLGDVGYQMADVDITEVQDDADEVVVRYLVKPGPHLRLGKIHITGLQRTREHYVRDRLDLDEGVVLINDELVPALSRLRRTGLFRRLDVQLDPQGTIHDGAQQADILLELEEQAVRRVEVHGGYGNYEGVRGGVAYRDDNIFGIGRGWYVSGDVSQKHYEFSTGLIDRDLLGPNHRLEILGSYLFREEPAFDRTVFVIEPAVDLRLAADHRLRVAYAVDGQRAEDNSSSIGGVDTEDLVINAFIDVAWRWDRRDDVWLPTKGTLLEVGVGVSDPSIGSELSYIEYRIAAGLIWPVIEKPQTIIAIGGRITSRKTTDGSPTLPITQRLFNGGANTVRSFDRDHLGPVGDGGDPQGGLTSAHANLELRQELAGPLHGAIFFDVGTVNEKHFELDSPLGIGLGGGLRYLLPVGPVRLDAAWNPGERFANKDPYSFHLAVGFLF